VTARQSAADIIRALALAPHPEGGYYRETFRDPRVIDGRAASTSINRKWQRCDWACDDQAAAWPSAETM